jgi:hypothetical protein
MVAENKPDYILVDLAAKMDVNTRAHEYEDAVCRLLIAFCQLVVFFLCNLGVDGEEWP